MPRRPARSEDDDNAARAAALIRLTRELDAMTWRRDALAAVPQGWASVDRDNPVHPRRVKLTLRLDEDVARFFRAQGLGYQGRINAVLRAYMSAKLSGLA